MRKNVSLLFKNHLNVHFFTLFTSYIRFRCFQTDIILALVISKWHDQVHLMLRLWYSMNFEDPVTCALLGPCTFFLNLINTTRHISLDKRSNFGQTCCISCEQNEQTRLICRRMSTRSSASWIRRYQNLAAKREVEALRCAHFPCACW